MVCQVLETPILQHQLSLRYNVSINLYLAVCLNFPDSTKPDKANALIVRKKERHAQTSSSIPEPFDPTRPQAIRATIETAKIDIFLMLCKKSSEKCIFYFVYGQK